MKKEDLKICLLRTPAVIPASSMNSSSIVPSLALGYLWSALDTNGYTATIVDSQMEAIGQLNAIENIKDFVTHGLSCNEIIEMIPVDTEILGVSVMFSSEWPYVRELIKKIKKQYPEIFIIAGGEHITAVPEFTLEQCPALDIGVLGEGEETLIDLLEVYRTDEDFSKVNGIILHKNEQSLKTLHRKRIKAVNDIPWPKWDDKTLNKFFASEQSHGPYSGRTMPIMGSRGCPYDCQFCSNRTMWGNYYWSRDPKDVVNEIEHYVNSYEIKCFEFMDLTVYMKKAWIIDFCNELIARELDVTWQCTGGTRTEAIDENIIQLTKKAGCTYLGFAPESGSERVLVDIKKKIKLSKMINLYKIMRKHNVGTRANLIIGFPDEKRVDIFRTIWLQVKLVFLGVLDAPLFIFTPYPGSGFFKLLIDREVVPNLKTSDKKILDDYFYGLAQDFGTVSGKGYNKNIGIKELRVYQTLGMAFFYGLQYLIYPSRTISFMKSIFGLKQSNSVFEQRIIQNLLIKKEKRVNRHNL